MRVPWPLCRDQRIVKQPWQTDHRLREMCGIAGIVRSERLHSEDESVARNMLASLAHRGPDDQFLMGNDMAMVGACRLAIIDLDGGRQPLTDESGRIWVSQNGEIYNYLELRQELLSRGHALSTAGDTEVIAHLYEEFGDEFVHRLRGMFAIAIWDDRKHRLVLVRDRIGKKPLYWHLADGRMSYASELKALMGPAAVPRVVDREALALYLQYQYVPSPKTILKDVYKLPPASILSWSGGEPSVRRYWQLSYNPVSQSAETSASECLALLRESVRLRMRSDVPIGVFLSGGMDSSVVAALVAEASTRPVQTLSIGFEERDFNELPYAKRVAEYLGTDHAEEVVRLDALGQLPLLARHLDEPFGDSSALPTFRVAQMASDLKVVLTGDGGDESFAGYDRYRLQSAFAMLDRTPAAVRTVIATAGPVALAVMRRRPRTLAWRAFASEGFDARYVRLMSVFNPEEVDEIMRESQGAMSGTYLLDSLRSGPNAQVNRMLRADTMTYLPEDLLVKVDRMTMAHSLEARSPLLDHKVLEFAAALPEHQKLHRTTSKWLLRQVARRLMPAALVDRPKMGFGVPVGSWFRAELGNTFRELVLASDAAARDLIDTRPAADLINQHAAGIHDHSHRLWVLLMLELWARTWLREPLGTLS